MDTSIEQPSSDHPSWSEVVKSNMPDEAPESQAQDMNNNNQLPGKAGANPAKEEAHDHELSPSDKQMPPMPQPVQVSTAQGHNPSGDADRRPTTTPSTKESVIADKKTNTASNPSNAAEHVWADVVKSNLNPDEEELEAAAEKVHEQIPEESLIPKQAIESEQQQKDPEQVPSYERDLEEEEKIKQAEKSQAQQQESKQQQQKPQQQRSEKQQQQQESQAKPQQESQAKSQQQKSQDRDASSQQKSGQQQQGKQQESKQQDSKQQRSQNDDDEHHVSKFQKQENQIPTFQLPDDRKTVAKEGQQQRSEQQQQRPEQKQQQQQQQQSSSKMPQDKQHPKLQQPDFPQESQQQSSSKSQQRSKSHQKQESEESVDISDGQDGEMQGNEKRVSKRQRPATDVDGTKDNSILTAFLLFAKATFLLPLSILLDPKRSILMLPLLIPVLAVLPLLLLLVLPVLGLRFALNIGSQVKQQVLKKAPRSVNAR